MSFWEIGVLLLQESTAASLSTGPLSVFCSPHQSYSCTLSKYLQIACACNHTVNVLLEGFDHVGRGSCSFVIGLIYLVCIPVSYLMPSSSQPHRGDRCRSSAFNLCSVPWNIKSKVEIKLEQSTSKPQRPPATRKNRRC